MVIKVRVEDQISAEMSKSTKIPTGTLVNFYELLINEEGYRVRTSSSDVKWAQVYVQFDDSIFSSSPSGALEKIVISEATGKNEATKFLMCKGVNNFFQKYVLSHVRISPTLTAVLNDKVMRLDKALERLDPEGLKRLQNSQSSTIPPAQWVSATNEAPFTVHESVSGLERTVRVMEVKIVETTASNSREVLLESFPKTNAAFITYKDGKPFQGQRPILAANSVSSETPGKIVRILVLISLIFGVGIIINGFIRRNQRSSTTKTNEKKIYDNQ